MQKTKSTGGQIINAPKTKKLNDVHKTQMITVWFIITCQMSFLSQTTLKTVRSSPRHITALQIAAGSVQVKANAFIGGDGDSRLSLRRMHVADAYSTKQSADMFNEVRRMDSIIQMSGAFVSI